MANERRSKKRQASTPSCLQRKKLSDITNLQNLPSCEESEEEPAATWVTQLQKEITSLRKSLAEKDDLLLEKDAIIEKLTLSLEQRSAQNEEIIQHYYKQYKDLAQAREELKLSQHECTQMTSVYRISKNELQLKLAEANERINQLLEERQKQSRSLPKSIKKQPSTQLKQSKKRDRRASSDLSSCSTKLIEIREEDDNSICSSWQRKTAAAAAAAAAAATASTTVSASAAASPPTTATASTAAAAATPAVTVATTATTIATAVTAPTASTGAAAAATATATATANQIQRSSGRPVRKAAAITSYKELPLNTKMRRPS